ncbi:hypothetical protein B9Z65_3188 [Elsinoe australis]|uniref:Uncharacterized protein n=1 Tax=Elsinoe australis TaxID=40998 RepID=A0A2P7ZUN6_9PEZI|nr:hypothetical protein B9Z65_3188 [Elsinoe australis]
MKKLAKDGWHPSFDDKFKIDRNNIKNPRQWVGGKKDDPLERANSHQSAPLSSLRDPSEFAPPPKHINYHGAEASRPMITNPASPASSTQSSALVPAVDTRRYDTDSGGLGGAISQETVSAWQQTKQRQQEEAEQPKASTGPYRKDTTGLRTDHLPPPPVRRGTGTASPSSPAPSRIPTSAVNKPPLPPPSAGSSSPAKPRAPPSLPPRLPPRQSTEPNEYTPPPPPTYNEALSQPQTPAASAPQSFPAPSSSISTNTSSLSRLASSGVSVPSLGVSRNPASPPPQPSSPASRFGQSGGMSELQSRFNKLGTNSSSNPTASNATQSPQQNGGSASPMSASSLGGAYNTFNKATQDPSKVSLSEARSATSTANAVNQRYGAQIAQGVGAANRFAGGPGGGVGGGHGDGAGGSGTGNAGFAALANVAQKKKAPPPPPSRGNGGVGQGTAGGGGGAPPPPVPMGSKPRV